MDNKTKSLSLTTAKSVDTEGERRVTFVASDASTDRDGEYMVIDTLRLPLKGGGQMKVADIPAEGTTDIDIPLLVNHDLWSVEKVIGSVRRATYEDGKLIFEAGISSRDYAQDLFKLIDEGHLDNSWSISVNDYDYDHSDGAISNGEIVEVSLVTRGSNRDAQVLAVKSAKEKSMDEESKAPEVEEVKGETVAETTEETTEPTAEAPEAEATDEAVETEEVKDEGEAEKPTEDTNETKEKTMDKTVTKTLARAEADQTVTSKSTDGYLKSKAAVKDFTETIIATKTLGPKAVMKAWSDKLAEKGITGDAILPTQIEQIFFKTWSDNDSILGTFRTINANAAALNAFTGTGEGIRAKGHKKGETKAEQTVTNIRRDLKAKIVYKMLSVDLQDLLDDQTGELLAFRVEELARRVGNEIAVGAVLGDGRTAPASDSDPDYRVFDGTRGLWSMVADINGSTTVNSYASAVAKIVANVNTDNLYDKIVKVLAQVDDLGFGKAIVVPKGSMSDLRLLKGQDGHYIFQPGATVEDAIGARIFEMDGMEGAGYDVIAYAINGYALYATNNMVRTQFNLNNNTDTMLVERSVAGSLYGNRAAAGYASATASA